jgi:hypothetical protein
MKKLLLMPYAVLILVFTLGSCSVDKRVYRPGYNVTWHQNRTEIKQNPAREEIQESVAAEKNVTTPAPEEKTDVLIPSEEEVATASIQEKPVTSSIEEKPAVVKKEKGFLSKIIGEDTPEDEAKINAGSKAAAFKSGFKKGIKVMMMPVQDDGRITGWAIASFVLGLVSLVSYYGAFLLGLLAIIFGVIAINKIRNGGYRGNTLAWIGIICGIVSIVLAIVIIKIY